MADLIKIPYGYVVSIDTDEWAIVCASIKTAITIVEKSGETQELSEEDKKDLEKFQRLLADLLTPKNSYGSENLN